MADSDKREMTDLEFNELLNGPLSHPLPMFTIARLTLALKCVVMATGAAGAETLRSYCRERNERDEKTE